MASPLEAPSEAFSRLDVQDGASANPWQHAIDAKNAGETQTPQPRPVVADGIESDPWAEPSKETSAVAQDSPALINLEPNQDGTAWQDMDTSKIVVQSPSTHIGDQAVEDHNVWDDLASLEDRSKGKLPEAAQNEDWNLVDVEPAPKAEDPDEKPPLPTRTPAEPRPKWVPSRPPVDGKMETYLVKNVRWHDPASGKNPRTSPILIQNENGPCPLVALVNALTMTTPATEDTALVQALRSREQISLNLVLDVVFDELMSPRRSSSQVALPDVSDLYAFLQSLHTGMNVNPRFVPTPEMVKAYKRTSLTHLHPTERGALIPGTFENTTEMSLYATFSIPLIHGWLPTREDAAYEAMERQACSYEDVQNLLFREEELEEKLSNAGLTQDEQQLYQDIMTIKMFLNASATQLTPWGIEVISKAMRPGTFAILFRNDHFSTLYCHPDTTQLLSLVTDAGYRTHDEVVWESLADVNGERTEYLSGDFRVVSAGSNLPSGSENAGSGEWQTVAKRGKGKQQNEQGISHEQEDRDLALALQLQEEEDQRQRDEQARRQRETRLSEQFIEQQGHRPTPVNRNPRQSRRSSSSSVPVPVTTTTSGRRPSQVQPPAQAVPVRRTQRPGVTRADSHTEDAPPSYEQAAHEPAFVPPASVSDQGQAHRVQMQQPVQQPVQPMRRPVAQAVGTGHRDRDRDRDCTVM